MIYGGLLLFFMGFLWVIMGNFMTHFLKINQGSAVEQSKNGIFFCILDESLDFKTETTLN